MNFLKNTILKHFGTKSIDDRLTKIEETLNFIINNSFEIEDIKAKPSIKSIQEDQFSIFLKLIEFFEKLNIEYFLFAGTLLGSVRHKGFVPWDDDIDIGVLKEDFNIILENENLLKEWNLYLSSPFSKAEIYNGKGYDKIYDYEGSEHVSIIVFDLVETEDIFKVLSRRTKYNKLTAKLRKGYLNNFRRSKNKMVKVNNNYYKSLHTVSKKNASKNAFLIKSLCAAKKNIYVPFTDMYPLQKGEFFVFKDQKKYNFPIPKKPKVMLENFYGKDYMHFPKDVYPQHRK